MAVLTGEHKAYILKQVASFNISAKAIAKELGNAEIAMIHGFKTVKKLSRQTVWAHIQIIDPIVIEKVQNAFLSDFSDIPLVYKKVRLKELSDMYMKLKDNKGKIDVITRRNMMINILNQIRVHGGEEIDRLIDALTNCGDTNVTNNYHIDISGRTDADKSTIRDNINAAYNFNRSRF